MIAESRHSPGRGITGITAALAAGFIGLVPLAAGASQGSRQQFEAPAVIVKYADLDINTPRGAERLYERIEQAAVSLCPQVGFQEIQRYAASLRCRNDVVAHAVSRVNSPQLAAVFASRTRHGARPV